METELRKIRENQEGHNKTDADYQKTTDVRMEKQDGVLNLIKESIEQLHNKVDVVDQKISYTNGKVASLTSWKFYASGAAAIIIGLMSLILPFVISEYLHSRETSISQDDVRKIISQILDEKAVITK